MIITCADCGSSFTLNNDLLKASGTKVRCSICKHVFRAYPETSPSPAMAAVGSSDFLTPVPTEPSPEDPDLSDAVAQIIDNAIAFSDEELDITPSAKKAKTDPPPQDTEKKGDSILEFSDFEDGKKPPEPPPESSGAAMGSSASLDLDLDIDAEDSTPQPQSQSANIDFDLSLDEQGLGAEESFDAGDDIEASAIDDDLDFSDLEKELSDSYEGTTEAEASLDIDDDLQPPIHEDELDFSDLEAELSDDPGPSDQGSMDNDFSTSMGDDELDLSDGLGIDLNDDQAALESEAEELDLSDFELDDEDDFAEPVADSNVQGAVSEVSAENEELDFSDLEDALGDDALDGMSSSDDGLDMDMDMDLDLDDEPPQTSAASDINEEELIADEELDFSDLENMLDEPGNQDASIIDNEVDDDIELELDLDSDQEEGDGPDFASMDLDDDDSFDFSDVEAMLDADDGIEEGEDLQLDLDLDQADDNDLQIEAPPTQPPPTARAADPALVEESTMKMPSAPKPTKKKKLKSKKVKPKKAKKFKKFKPRKSAGEQILSILIKLIILTIIAVVVVSVFLFRGPIESATGFKIPEIDQIEDLRQPLIDKKIPYVSTWATIKDTDVRGVLKLKTSGIDGKLMTNEHVGDIFVIDGYIKNTYQNTRNSLSIRCSLNDAKDAVIKSRVVYAGNKIDTDQLETLTMEDLIELMKRKLGKANSNAKVRPNKRLPFTAVFAITETDDIAKYVVEPNGSFKGQAALD